MDAEFCFLYSQQNRDYSNVLGIIKEKKFVSWWEIEAELAAKKIMPNVGPGLGLAGSQNFRHLDSGAFKGALINLIPVSCDIVHQFLNNILQNPVIAKFTEVRKMVWEEFGNEYWLDLEINYGTTGTVAKLNALNRHMEVIRF